MRLFFAVLVAASPLVACANRSLTEIDIEDAGLPTRVKYGTVIAARPASVRTDPSSAIGVGALGGGLAGALISQTNGGAIAGLVLGGLSGGLGHRLAETDNAVEYSIAMQGGETIVVVQAQSQAEPALPPGAAVAVQFGAKINRVLDARGWPAVLPAPKRVTIAGGKPPPDEAGARLCVKASMGDGSRESCAQH